MKRFLSIFSFLAIFFGASARVEAVPYLWRLVDKIQPKFEMYHTQGLAKIGDRFYLSAVEVKDKGDGQGVGHFFEFDAQGNLVKQITLGEGAMYHPGGIDFDGQWIWVPVSEYKSRSHAIIYKINPQTLQATEAFRVEDHIGAVVFNRELKTLIGMNWDSRAFYEWTPEGKMIRKVINDMSDYSYQDCKYLQGPAMLCSGTRANANGGLAVVDLLDFGLIQDIQTVPRTPKKTLMTRNPMGIDVVDQKIRYYFLPEDHNGPMYIFEIY